MNTSKVNSKIKRIDLLLSFVTLGLAVLVIIQQQIISMIMAAGL